MPDQIALATPRPEMKMVPSMSKDRSMVEYTFGPSMTLEAGSASKLLNEESAKYSANKPPG